MHFNAAQAFSFPAHAFDLNSSFFTGVGAALLIAVYDYWGYYNVCYLGAEIRDPGRVIPRAILLSIAGVSVMYLTMNISILGSMPWQEVEKSTFIASDFMERMWGPRAGVIVTGLICGPPSPRCSRCCSAIRACPTRRRSTATISARSRSCTRGTGSRTSRVLGGMAIVFCLFRLADVVTALVVIRIMVQFLAQTIGIMVLRARRPDMPRPFRMWFYPLPAVLAFIGYIYTVVMRPKSLESIRLAVVVLVVGSILFWIRQRRDEAITPGSAV
jgi:amino acid transporter